MSLKNNALFTYLRGAKEELEKTTWPTRRQALVYSFAIAAISVALAVYFGVLDFALTAGLEKLLIK